MKPIWGCSEWGQYEHDWLDCYECIQAYERWLECEMTPESLLSAAGYIAVMATRLPDNSLRIGPEAPVSDWPKDFTVGGVLFVFDEEEEVGPVDGGTHVQGFYVQQEKKPENVT